MAKVTNPGRAIIFMKIGTHAQESLDDILARKRQEFEQTGRIFWGYGGNTCHPTNLVQPFVRDQQTSGNQVSLAMMRIDSRHAAVPALAKEYSDDGIEWKKIPEGIRVAGSRYALVLGELLEAHFSLDLNRTRVAIGPSRGRTGDSYIQGRVDKGCLLVGESSQRPAVEPSSIVPISLVASLVAPYAVLVR